MEIIGAGFGRTGTLSLRSALEHLGYAPCYHMLEVFQKPQHAEVWQQALLGEAPDWTRFLADYRAGVDWPICHFWRELAVAFPEARFILTRRDSEAWYASISQTIFDSVLKAGPAEGVRGTQQRMAHVLLDKAFQGRFDKDHVIAVYEAHNRTVANAFGPERLLVYEVSEGWEPLCRFLGCATPSEPFPRTNSTAEFRARIGR